MLPAKYSLWLYQEKHDYQKVRLSDKQMDRGQKKLALCAAMLCRTIRESSQCPIFFYPARTKDHDLWCQWSLSCVEPTAQVSLLYKLYHLQHINLKCCTLNVWCIIIFNQCKIQKNWCTVTVAPTIEHHGGHSRTPANQRWDQLPGRSQRLLLGTTPKSRSQFTNGKNSPPVYNFILWTCEFETG